MNEKDPTVDTELLDDLEDAALEATPGPWEYFPKPKYSEHHVSIPVNGSTMRMALFAEGCQTERSEQDAKFIAAANPEAILGIVRYARTAKHLLEVRTPTGNERLIRHLVAALKTADASLRKVTREGTQYDAWDIHEAVTDIKHAIEAAQDSGAMDAKS